MIFDIDKVQLLLTYNENAVSKNSNFLKTFNIIFGKVKKFFYAFIKHLYAPFCIVIAFFCGVFIIDSINLPFANKMMSYIDNVFNYTFSGSEDVSFVSKILKTYKIKYDFASQNFAHIVHYDQIIQTEDSIQYIAYSVNTVYAPCDAIVHSVEWVDGENVLTLKIDSSTYIIISGKIIFGVQPDVIVSQKNIIGLNYGHEHPITFKVYKNGKIVQNLLAEYEWIN